MNKTNLYFLKTFLPKFAVVAGNSSKKQIANTIKSL